MYLEIQIIYSGQNTSKMGASIVLTVVEYHSSGPLMHVSIYVLHLNSPAVSIVTIRSIPSVLRSMSINRSNWLGSCLILSKASLTSSPSVGFAAISNHSFCWQSLVNLSLAPGFNCRVWVMAFSLLRTLSYPVTINNIPLHPLKGGVCIGKVQMLGKGRLENQEA